MNSLVHGCLVFATLIATASYPEPQPGDRWWDIINTNGRVVWLDQDRIWQNGMKTFAVHRIAPIVNGHSDYTNQPDLIFVTDCHNHAKSFGVYEDWENAPLMTVGGLGLAMVRAICGSRQF